MKQSKLIYIILKQKKNIFKLKIREVGELEDNWWRLGLKSRSFWLCGLHALRHIGVRLDCAEVSFT